MSIELISEPLNVANSIDKSSGRNRLLGLM